MRVIITDTAIESLWPIYQYHQRYSEQYADQFQHDLDQYIVTSLQDNPKIGLVYNTVKNIRRLIYQKRYNVYYTIMDNIVYVLFIYHGRMNINTLIETDDIELFLNQSDHDPS